ncbi:hypothetical protein CKO38_16150, partial [Rhodospirillum rubrum]|nr:hypothetical protein [Rhodospirillum rubrum]
MRRFPFLPLVAALLVSLATACAGPPPSTPKQAAVRVERTHQ